MTSPEEQNVSEENIEAVEELVSDAVEVVEEVCCSYARTDRPRSPGPDRRSPQGGCRSRPDGSRYRSVQAQTVVRWRTTSPTRFTSS